jgi:hypothetical protein
MTSRAERNDRRTGFAGIRGASKRLAPAIAQQRSDQKLRRRFHQGRAHRRDGAILLGNDFIRSGEPLFVLAPEFLDGHG